MIIGFLSLDIHLPYSHSLKEKRKRLKSLKDRLQKKYNVAYSELEFQDKWQRSKIGIVTLNNRKSIIEKVFQQILRECEENLDGEILKKIIIPEPYSKSIFYKLGLRQAMAISVINFAIAYEDNKVTIAVGAVAPTVLKFEFKGQLSVEKIVQEIEQGISPIDDIRATAEYRRKVLKNMLSYELAKIL